MRGFPPELIYILLIVGFFLVQLLMKRRVAREPRDARNDDRIPDAPDEVPTDFAWPGQAAPMVASLPPASVDPRVRSEAPAAVRTSARLRFSRRSLLGTRRDVQNAVVIATILGPCRALEPRGGDGVSTTARRTVG
jgi:hypothetical protein